VILNDFSYFFYQHIFTFALNMATLGKKPQLSPFQI